MNTLTLVIVAVTNQGLSSLPGSQTTLPPLRKKTRRPCPTTLKGFNFYPSPTLNINMHIHSVSAYGLVIMLAEMPKKRGQQSRRPIPVAIQRHRRRGRLSLCVAIYLRTAFPTSKRSFPTTVKRTSANIVRLWPLFLKNSPKRKSRTVRNVLRSGMLNHYQMRCNESK
jgi:hypothetical protein